MAFTFHSYKREKMSQFLLMGISAFLKLQNLFLVNSGPLVISRL